MYKQEELSIGALSPTMYRKPMRPCIQFGQGVILSFLSIIAIYFITRGTHRPYKEKPTFLAYISQNIALYINYSYVHLYKTGVTYRLAVSEVSAWTTTPQRRLSSTTANAQARSREGGIIIHLSARGRIQSINGRCPV